MYNHSVCRNDIDIAIVSPSAKNISLYKEPICLPLAWPLPSSAAVAGSLPPGQVPLQEQLLKVCPKNEPQEDL